VWPGSAQTALLFVGLPLLTALVLLASPLHDAPAPLPREEAAAPDSVSAPEPRFVELQPAPAAMPRPVATRPAHDEAVPAVIYEVRRTGRYRAREDAGAPVSGSAPAVMPTSRPRLRPVTSVEPVAAVAASAEARIIAASLAQQSP